ncbi:MAG: hypothetical protein HPY74_09480 [Firmicutes bacterium]|nr:hypothetical protein [Bacillota bacterium]
MFNENDKRENCTKEENLRKNEYDKIREIDILVNLVNIADVIDSAESTVVTSNIILIGIEPYAFNKIILDGLKERIKISRDQEGNVIINEKKAKFINLGNGIKVLVALKEEKE